VQLRSGADWRNTFSMRVLHRCGIFQINRFLTKVSRLLSCRIEISLSPSFVDMLVSSLRRMSPTLWDSRGDFRHPARPEHISPDLHESVVQHAKRTNSRRPASGNNDVKILNLVLRCGSQFLRKTRGKAQVFLPMGWLWNMFIVGRVPLKAGLRDLFQ
jgi:hypothetical protein